MVTDTKLKMSSTLKRKLTPEICRQEKRCRVAENHQFDFSIFPNEIKEVVIQNLKNSDLKNCRLLSKQINCIVDQRTNLWKVSSQHFCRAASKGERNVCSLFCRSRKIMYYSLFPVSLLLWNGATLQIYFPSLLYLHFQYPQ